MQGGNMNKGHWRVFLKNGTMFDDEKCYYIDCLSDFVRGYLEGKKDILFVINTNEFSCAVWVE